MFKFLGPRSRMSYWSCSDFADKIRGIEKPLALTLEGWDEWKINASKKHPIRFYIAEELLDEVQDFLNFPRDLYRAARIYIRNRYIDKIHYLKTGLTPGQYYDLDHRIMHALFNELVIFVEIEATLDHLEWSSRLTHGEDDGVSPEDELYGKPTRHAKESLEIIELYNWWKKRDERKDPMVESGWDNYCDKPKEERTEKEKNISLEKLIEIEEKYEKEDEEMLIRLIKIRKSLWTT
jgi:hypothetical protein